MLRTDPSHLVEPLPQCPPELCGTNSPVEHLRICHGLIRRTDIDLSLLAWLFVYQRLLGSRQARQGMAAHYQTKDVSHIQDTFSLALSKAYAETHARGSTDGPVERALIRNLIALVPRGGGNGDELRLYILDIMRRHNIREGHRPGVDDPFLEQWHQKLHSASTWEDIPICEAYIAYQETGSHHRFFQALWERGRLTAEDLKRMPRPLTHLPRHRPQILGDLPHLLWILKQIHAGSENLHYLIEVSRWQLDGPTLSVLERIRDNFGAWWIPGKVVEARKALQPRLTGGTPRDPLMLDVALDGLFKTSIERLDLGSMRKDDLTELVGLALENLALSCDHEPIRLGRALWDRIRHARQDGWSRTSSLRAVAGLSSLQLLVQSYSSLFHGLLQPRAQAFGLKLGVATSYVTNFAEEVIRSHGVFCLARLVDALAPALREGAGVRSWRIVSRGEMPATGAVAVARSLAAACECAAPARAGRILVVEEVDGTEDLTDRITAVITPAEVDLLSHLAIRARAAGILLATCNDERELSRLRQREGAWLRLKTDGESVEISETNESDDENRATASALHDVVKLVTHHEPAVSGLDGRRSKSANLELLARAMPTDFELPASVTLEPELFVQALNSAPETCASVARWESSLQGLASEDRAILREIREAVANMPLHRSVVEAIRCRLIQAGLLAADCPQAELATCRAVTKVWASVWNDRAQRSRAARGVSRERVRMGVLIQRAIPADYAFVVHTRHPVTDDPREMSIEIVVGWGETLASNAAGTPLRATASRDARTHRIESYPSKAYALRGSRPEGTLIARSDCNDEDQRGFSGAGLYDSFLVDPPSVTSVPYAEEKLLWDEAFVHGLIERIVHAAEAVEETMGGPQDIEGVFGNGRLYVVQTRDQTGGWGGHEAAFGRGRLEVPDAVS